MRKFFILVSIFLLPNLAFAAGFAKQSLFLSQSTVTEGQTVFIYAVVNDESPNSFSGTLNFSDETGPIGKVSVSLESGKATTASVSWSPKAGTHTVTAALTSSAGEAVESEDAIFVVNPTLVPADALSDSDTTASSSIFTKLSPSTQTTVGSSTPIINSIERISPQLGAKSVPAFNTVDAWRGDATTKLNQGTNWSKINLTKAAATPGSIKNTLWLILNTFVLYFCSALAYAFANIGIFYPVLVFIFFYILWKSYRMVRG